jgi:FixJ family two-component response regulator
VHTERTLIAIVDDEESVRRALQRLMVSAGFQADSFASGTDFLDSLRAKLPDCVVLDLHMPLVSGFDVQLKLAAEARQIPVVVITGHDTPESKARVLGAGAAAYLRKPIDDQVLLDAVANAISGKSTGHSNGKTSPPPL